MLYRFVIMLTIYNIAAVQLVPFKPDIYPNDSRVFCLEDIEDLPLTSSAPHSSTELGNVLVCRTDRSPAVQLYLTDLVNGLIIIRL